MASPAAASTQLGAWQKAMRKEKSKLFSFMDDDIPITSNVSNEDANKFQQYLADPNIIKNDNVLRFWRANHTYYPVLSQIAQKNYSGSGNICSN